MSKNNPRCFSKLRDDHIVTGDFAAVFEEYAALKPEKPQLTIPSILMLGAKIEGNDLLPQDLLRLRQIIEFLYRHNISFETTEIHISNLEYGHDMALADNAIPYDDDWGLLMLCWVNKSGQGFDDEGFNPESLLVKSGEKTWPKIFEAAGGKFIANFSDQYTCIPDTDIPSDYYKEMEYKGFRPTGMSMFYRIA